MEVDILAADGRLNERCAGARRAWRRDLRNMEPANIDPEAVGGHVVQIGTVYAGWQQQDTGFVEQALGEALDAVRPL